MKKIFTTLLFSFVIFSMANAAFEIKRTVFVGQNAQGAAANAFNSNNLVCFVGDTIEFKWFSGSQHFVGAIGGPWPLQEVLVLTGFTFTAQTATYLFVIPTAGTYSYTCFTHPNMIGSFNATVNPASVQVTPYFSVDLKSYPNPTKENLNVTFNSNSSTKGQFKVYDIQGKAVIKEEIEIIPGANIYSLSVATLNSGLYFMEVYQDGKKIGVKKFAKN